MLTQNLIIDNYLSGLLEKSCLINYQCHQIEKSEDVENLLLILLPVRREMAVY